MKWRGLGSPWFNYTVQTSLWWIVLQQGGKLWFFVMPLKNLLSAVIIQHLIKSISILRAYRVFQHSSPQSHLRKKVIRIQLPMRKFVALRLFHWDLDIVYQKFLLIPIKYYFPKLGTIRSSIDSNISLRELGVLLSSFPQCR